MGLQQAHPELQVPQVTLGNALLTIGDPLFLEGYTRGFRDYCRYDCKELLSDTRIRRMIKRRQCNTTRSEMWNVGYVMGWITATHGIPRLRHFCKPVRHQRSLKHAERH